MVRLGGRFPVIAILRLMTDLWPLTTMTPYHHLLDFRISRLNVFYTLGALWCTLVSWGAFPNNRQIIAKYLANLRA